MAGTEDEMNDAVNPTDPSSVCDDETLCPSPDGWQSPKELFPDYQGPIAERPPTIKWGQTQSPRPDARATAGAQPQPQPELVPPFAGVGSAEPPDDTWQPGDFIRQQRTSEEIVSVRRLFR